MDTRDIFRRTSWGGAIARAHVDEFVGLLLDEARQLAEELHVPIKILRPGAAVSLELQVGRINLTLDAQDRVTRATVTG